MAHPSSQRGVSQAIALEEVNSILPEVAVQPYGVLGVLDRGAPAVFSEMRQLSRFGICFIYIYIALCVL